MKAKVYFKQIVLEVPSILIAVILAIYLTNWFDNKNKHEKANVIISFIEEEIATNLKSLHGVVDSLTWQRVKSYDSLIQLYNQNKIDVFPENNIRPTMRNVAWESAKTSDVFSEISPKKANQISYVYQEQKRVEDILKIQDEFNIKKSFELTELQKGKYYRNINEKLSQRYNDLITRYADYLKLNSEDLAKIKNENRRNFNREMNRLKR